MVSGAANLCSPFLFNMHSLSVTYLSSNCCKNLTFRDDSIYDADIPVLNTILEIKPPGQCCFISFDLLLGWCSKTFSCEDLNVCCIENSLSIIPDGNYEIKYSINPNIYTLVSYNHFRVCQLQKSLAHAICFLRERKCDYSKSEWKIEINKLYYIRNMILDAVVLAEECLDIDNAYFLYEEAKNLLNDKGCPTC